MTLPTLFISHGSPMHAVRAGRAGEGWARLAASLPRPRAVVIVSAHWETELPMVGAGARPETIHDFGGFPDELYRIRYAAPGAPDVAQRAVALLQAAGTPATTNACRGLDHGAWVPLLHMYPDADVPVTQVSIQPTLGSAHHLRLGAALAPLAEDDVLVIGSGHMTHNLRDWIAFARRHAMEPVDTPPVDYVAEFRGWIDDALRRDHRDALAQWYEQAPHARRAHPTIEHMLPLHVAFAAAGPAPAVERIDLGVDAGVLAMDTYVFRQRH